MVPDRSKYVILILSLLMLMQACTLTGRSVGERKADGKYDSEFPDRPVSRQLQDVMASVKLINSIAQYRSFRYARNAANTNADSLLLHRAAVATSLENETASGTATLVYDDHVRIAVLTCAHIVNNPETLITTYQKPRSIERIRLRQSLKLYINDFAGQNYFEILAMDPARDLALLGKKYHAPAHTRPRVFTLPAGRSRDLQWGSFVYQVGFPKGNLMVTRGIVSLKPDDPRGNFLVDALFNHGSSGGLVLAFRDGMRNMEWVGMCYSVSADYSTLLAPAALPAGESYSPGQPYSGPMTVDQNGRINYGITNVISVEQIRHFIDEYSASLEKSGYDMSHFFIQPE